MTVGSHLKTPVRKPPSIKLLSSKGECMRACTQCLVTAAFGMHMNVCATVVRVAAKKWCKGATSSEVKPQCHRTTPLPSCWTGVASMTLFVGPAEPSIVTVRQLYPGMLYRGPTVFFMAVSSKLCYIKQEIWSGMPYCNIAIFIWHEYSSIE